MQTFAKSMSMTQRVIYHPQQGQTYSYEFWVENRNNLDFVFTNKNALKTIHMVMFNKLEYS